MVRLVVYAALIYLIYTLVKKFILGGGNARNAPEAGREDSGEHVESEAEETVQDTVCGSFVVKSVAKSVSRGGALHYFCSDECRDKFLNG